VPRDWLLELGHTRLKVGRRLAGEQPRGVGFEVVGRDAMGGVEADHASGGIASASSRSAVAIIT